MFSDIRNTLSNAQEDEREDSEEWEYLEEPSNQHINTKDDPSPTNGKSLRQNKKIKTLNNN